jgi:CRP-like cAMP-binding protein
MVVTNNECPPQTEKPSVSTLERKMPASFRNNSKHWRDRALMPAQSYGRNAFLSALSEPDLALVRSYLTRFDLCLDDSLHAVGDEIDRIIFPHSGLVAMIPLSKEGGSVATLLVGRDGVVGGFGAAASAAAVCEARVLIAGEASHMSAASFRYLLDQSPSFRWHAARFDSAMLAQAQQTALCNAVHPVEARICRWLLEIQDRTGSSKIPLKQATLAQMLGSRRTTVTLIAGRLEVAGLIDGHRGYLHIINREELERHSCECYGQIRSHIAGLFEDSSLAASGTNPAHSRG